MIVKLNRFDKLWRNIYVLSYKIYEFTIKEINSDKRIKKVSVVPMFDGKAGMEVSEVLDIQTSCLDILEDGDSRGDGVYTIEQGEESLEVYCDMTTDGGGWTLYSDDPEYSIIDDATDAEYKLMKSFNIPIFISDTVNIKFSGYIQSGSYWWAWKIAKNGGNVLTFAEGGNAQGPFSSHLDIGETPSVHSYRRFNIDVQDLEPGDLLELWMVSSTSVGSPVNGDGQRLYAKEFKVYFR